jgi:hypothetical protein
VGSSGLQAYRFVTRVDTAVAGRITGLGISCGSDVAVGGGVTAQTNELAMVSSVFMDVHTWAGHFNNPTSADHQITLYAVCVRVGR